MRGERGNCFFPGKKKKKIRNDGKGRGGNCAIKKKHTRSETTTTAGRSSARRKRKTEQIGQERGRVGGNNCRIGNRISGKGERGDTSRHGHSKGKSGATSAQKTLRPRQREKQGKRRNGKKKDRGRGPWQKTDKGHERKEIMGPRKKKGGNRSASVKKKKPMTKHLSMSKKQRERKLVFWGGGGGGGFEGAVGKTSIHQEEETAKRNDHTKGGSRLRPKEPSEKERKYRGSGGDKPGLGGGKWFQNSSEKFLTREPKKRGGGNQREGLRVH